MEAGFARAEASASVDGAGSPEETRRHAAFLKAMLRPDAFYATTWCQAVGWLSD